MIRAALAAGLCGLAAAGTAHAAPWPDADTVIYSTLCHEAESGDAAGHRLTVQGRGANRILRFEWSEGGLCGGEVTRFGYRPTSGRLRFTVSGCGSGPAGDTYTARVIPGGVILSRVDFGDGQGARPLNQRLPRIEDLSGTIPDCPTPAPAPRPERR